MFNRRMFVVFAACVCATVMPVFAGGSGGTKKDSTIRVVNQTDTPVYAFVNVSDATLTAIAQSANPQQAAVNAGGKLIAAGGNPASFSVKSGDNTVTVATATTTPSIVFKETVKAPKGGTITVNVPGAAAM